MGLNHKIFYSKVLLFGEYTVTIGSGSIAMPYLQRSGYWDFDRRTIGSSTGLELLLKYLEDDKELSTMYLQVMV